jgi:hypothetical protein
MNCNGKRPNEILNLDFNFNDDYVIKILEKLLVYFLMINVNIIGFITKKVYDKTESESILFFCTILVETEVCMKVNFMDLFEKLC